jgi:hypothetical protein
MASAANNHGVPDPGALFNRCKGRLGFDRWLAAIVDFSDVLRTAGDEAARHSADQLAAGAVNFL